jgi:diguanylate cyclase (GGDEF)-like protein
MIEQGTTGEIDVARGRPKLLIVASAHDEQILVDQGLAEPIDEFCRDSASADEFRSRLARLLARMMAQLEGIDGLTGLMTRRGFVTIAAQALEHAAPESPVSVLLLDLDNFKTVNDSWGHSIGDQVLVEVAGLLREAALGVAVIARYGGEEFFLLVREDEQQTGALAEFLRSEIELIESDAGSDKPVRVTATFGLATSTGGVALEEMLKRADMALYHGKNEGKNRVIPYSDIAEGGSRTSLDMEIQGYEDRIRVLTQRLSDDLARRSRRMIARLRDDVERDGLTGLYNRRYFDERLPRELENVVRHDRFLSVAMIDLDKFGAVNRTYGFPGGDRALVLAAKTFREAVRTIDWVARYGGEEFVIVMPDTELHEAVAVAERVRERVAAGVTYAVDGREIRITASIGVVELDGTLLETAPEVPVFIQRASDKVREAKNGGRDQVRS